MMNTINLKHIISFLSLTLFMFLAVGSGGDDAEVQEDVQNTDTQFKVEANELAVAFENEVAGNEKYKGKVGEVTGIIGKIGTNEFTSDDEMYITLKVGGEYSFSGIRCTFSNEHKAEAAKLKSGEKITVKGLCDGMMVGDVRMKGCLIVK